MATCVSSYSLISVKFDVTVERSNQCHSGNIPQRSVRVVVFHKYSLFT
jgi:hypothetical protein